RFSRRPDAPSTHAARSRWTIASGAGQSSGRSLRVTGPPATSPELPPPGRQPRPRPVVGPHPTRYRRRSVTLEDLLLGPPGRRTRPGVGDTGTDLGSRPFG